jgi:hypothetical protein
MTDLSRNLLDAARECLSPDAAAMARVRAKVAASVAATSAAAVAVPTAKAATGLGVKVGLGLLVVAALGGVLVATRSHHGAESARIAIQTQDTDSARDAVRVSTTESHVASPTTPAASATTRPRTTPAPSASAPAPANAAEPVSLAREVELIDKAMLLVRRGDAQDAVGVIAMFDRETRGQGQMAEDAAAIDIEARCRLREDVTSKLAAFDRRWPSSAQRSRVQTACFAR